MADGQKYVVHGMRAKCSEGSMENYINTDVGHGIVYQGQPVLNANDHEKNVNLTHFGDCNSKLIYEEAKKQADEKYKTEEGDGFFSKIGKAVAKTVTKAVLDVKAVFASNKCELDTPLPWIFASRDHMIDGAPALTMESQCACKFGGIITIVPEAEEASEEESEQEEEVVEIEPNAVPLAAAASETAETGMKTKAEMAEGVTAGVAAALAGMAIAAKNKEVKENEINESSEGSISTQQLTEILVNTNHFQANAVTDSMAVELNRVLQEYNITTKQEVQMFLAATIHESRLSLSEAGWCGTETVKKYCEKYEPNTSIGKDLGNIQTGDGYKFRGAGYIQLTGRYNYQKFSEHIEIKYGYDAEIMKRGADYIITKYAWEAAGYYWNKNEINKIIQDGNDDNLDDIMIYKRVSNAINRGNADSKKDPGEWSDRQERFNEVLSAYE